MNKNQESKTIDKPDYMIKKETFITPSGTEITLGFIVVDINNTQISPSKNEVWLTKSYAKESLEILIRQMKEMKRLRMQLPNEVA